MQQMKEIPSDLDWVSVRSKCSLALVFESLKAQIQEDLEKQNALEGHAKFEMNRSGNTFTVLSATSSGIRSIYFVLSKNSIEVKNGDGKPQFEAFLTLNDAGECKLKVDEKELELWQVRRRALEELFFGPFSPSRN